MPQILSWQQTLIRRKVPGEKGTLWDKVFLCPMRHELRQNDLCCTETWQEDMSKDVT
jgi:hypothetical protein